MVQILILCMATLILLLPSLWNGFPFLFHDSGYYILHATMGITEWSILWRPLTYSYLLKPFLEFGSLSLFVVVQNIVLAVALYAAFTQTVGDAKRWAFLIVVAGLYFTAAPVLSNFIMTDVFAGLMIISFGCALTASSRPAFLGWSALYLFSCSAHYINLLVGTILVVLTLMFFKPAKRLKIWLLVLLAPWVILPSVHYMITNRFVISSSANIYLYSQLTSMGIAQKHLEQTCTEQPRLLCRDRHLGFHIWQQGPGTRIGQAGGIHALLPDIIASNQEILTGPLVFEFLQKSLLRMAQQFIWFGKPVEPVTSSQYLEMEIGMYSKMLAEDFRNQRIRDLPVHEAWEKLGPLYTGVILISLAILTFALARLPMSAQLRQLIWFSLLAYLVNAGVCGLLSDPDPRYSSRLAWIFPFLALLSLQKSSKSREPVS